MGFCEDGHLQDVPWRKIMKAFVKTLVVRWIKEMLCFILKTMEMVWATSLNISCGKCKKRKTLPVLIAKTEINILRIRMIIGNHL